MSKQNQRALSRRRARNLTAFLCATPLALGVGAGASVAQDTQALSRDTLATFEASIEAGAVPSGLVVTSTGVVYGTTSRGGVYGHGTVFVIRPGAARQVLYSFRGEADGGEPTTLVEGPFGNLYGLSARSGALVLFRVSATGRLRVVREFAADAGVVPSGSLVRAQDGTLYGSSGRAGGHVFRVSWFGNVSTLYSFASDTYADALVSTGGQLFGTTSAWTQQGMPSGSQATLFRLSSRGALRTLFSFESQNESATWSEALTAASDGTLYGVARSAGARDQFYRCSTAGSCELLSQGDSNGARMLTASPDGHVYGARSYDSQNTYGSVFELNADGTTRTLYAFEQGRDAPAPTALVYANGALYGARSNEHSLNGSVFRITTSGVGAELTRFVGHPNGMEPASLVRAPDGRLYGAMMAGGTYNGGTVFVFEEDAGLRVLYEFQGARDGARPTTLTLGSDGNLYGRTSAEGAAGAGTFFQLSPDGSLRVLRALEQSGAGEGPGLIEVEPGRFYAADRASWGRIVLLTAAGELEVLHQFSGLTGDGSGPSSLVLAPDGHLYGTTLGAYGPLIPPGYSAGTLFELALGAPLQTLATFGPNGTADGFQPSALLQAADGRFYVGTSALSFTCGDEQMGHLLSFTASAKTPETLYRFDGEQGVSPSLLVQSSAGRVFGATRGGLGYTEQGECVPMAASIFEITLPDQVTTLHRFSASDSGPTARPVALTAGKDGELVGLLSEGSTSPAELFRLSP